VALFGEHAAHARVLENHLVVGPARDEQQPHEQDDRVPERKPGACDPPAVTVPALAADTNDEPQPIKCVDTSVVAGDNSHVLSNRNKRSA
jgi:hypothetical protein